jgi:uncharacterized protein YkwD
MADRRHRSIAAALAAAVLALNATPARGHDQLRRGAVACPAAHAYPRATASARRVDEAVLCLIDRERARAGLAPLRRNRCLARAAQGHARDMVRRHYFAHTSRNGRTPVQRIFATGYVPPGSRWLLGENLAWGINPTGDPAWVVRAWMHSPAHRANVLRRGFRDVGVAAVAGVPVRVRGTGTLPRATYAIELGAHGGGHSRCG